jgi:hypothetical protein
MNLSTGCNGLRVTRLSGHDDAAGTLRIEYDRRRLVLTALASVLATGMASAALVLALMHGNRLSSSLLAAPGLDPKFVQLLGSVPWWTPVALGIAVLLAAVRMLRNFYRLQDSDPAFVLSPRDLRFKPALFGEAVRVPWTALRAVKARRHGKHRSLELRIADLERYVPGSGLLASLRRRRGSITLRVPLSRAALDELAALLQTHLDRYGKGAGDGTGPVTATPPPPQRRGALAG